MAHTISFQYIESGDDAPRAGYNITDQELTLPEGLHVPRVGEFVQIVTDVMSDSFLVLAVHTRISMFPGQAPGWHTYVTVGPDTDAPDIRLTYIRE
jgi:hypothetical protein